MAKTYIYERDKRGVAWVKFNRPEIHNAFDDTMIGELTELFAHIEEGTRAIVLSGEGRSFCAGADVNWMKRMKDYSDEDNFADSKRLSQMFQTLNQCPVPLIARVHGAALGGGGGLLAVCDYVIAAKNAKIGFTEVRLGLLPAVISPFVIAKIGESWARAALISGEIWSTHTAFHAGLVHSMVEEDQLDRRTQKVVDTFLKAGPRAICEAKKLTAEVLEKIKQGEDRQALADYTCRTISRIRVGSEAQEGMAALLEKRPPDWVG